MKEMASRTSKKRTDSPGAPGAALAAQYAANAAADAKKKEEEKKAEEAKKKSKEHSWCGIPQGVLVLFLGPVVPVVFAVLSMELFSLIPDLDKTRCRAFSIVSAVFISFFILYSGYRKVTPIDKGLSTFKGWLDFEDTLPKIFGELGSFTSNRQLNKVAALAGFTLCGLASLPGDMVWKGWSAERQYVLKAGVTSLFLHMSYSILSFYSLNPIRMLRGRGKHMKLEQLATFAGSCALTLFTWCSFRFGFLEFLGLQASYDSRTLAFACLLGMVHFYGMETRSGMPKDLPVRPWGYVPFIVAAVAVALWYFSDPVAAAATSASAATKAKVAAAGQ